MSESQLKTLCAALGWQGGTYCVKCQMHRPVAEFRWYEMDGTVGPVVGS